MLQKFDKWLSPKKDTLDALMLEDAFSDFNSPVNAAKIVRCLHRNRQDQDHSSEHIIYGPTFAERGFLIEESGAVTTLTADEASVSITDYETGT